MPKKQVKRKVNIQIEISKPQQKMLSSVSKLPKSIQAKLANKNKAFSVSDTGGMIKALLEEIPGTTEKRQQNLLDLSRYLLEQVAHSISPNAQLAAKEQANSTSAVNAENLYQFKITLVGLEPPIWRRIQIHDCSLDTLHGYIQMAMGWTNSHLHSFRINGELFGDPELLDDGFMSVEFFDSTTTMLSEILPTSSNRFSFLYEYDFGDGWQHEILFEGCPQPTKGAKYPICVEGEYCCPPEDCGGIHGYVEFLQAISDSEHEDHEYLLQWVGGHFDPDKFNPRQATKALKTVIPDWRRK